MGKRDFGGTHENNRHAILSFLARRGVPWLATTALCAAAPAHAADYYQFVQALAEAGNGDGVQGEQYQAVCDGNQVNGFCSTAFNPEEGTVVGPLAGPTNAAVSANGFAYNGIPGDEVGVSAEAAGSADLARGTLSVAAHTTGVAEYNYELGTSGQAQAEFADTLTFQGFTSPDQLATIGVTIRYTGTSANSFFGAGPHDGAPITELGFVCDCFYGPSEYLYLDGGLPLIPPNVLGNTAAPAGWIVGDGVVTGTFQIPGYSPTIETGFSLANLGGIGSNSSVDATDAQITASLSFTLPRGISYTSASGEFLADQAPVPEPRAWLLMLIGFGGLGAAARRRGSGGSAIRPDTRT